MKSRFLLFLSFCFVIISSCNDGDILTVEFDFEDDFEGCEESQLLFFKTKENPSESLSLLFSSLSYEELFAQTIENPLQFSGDTLSFADEAATFNYRTYDRDDLSNIFCNIVPPANLNISVDQTSAVNVDITRIIIEDDDDGIPRELEGPIDPLGDDDADGVFNFLDDDPNNASIGNTNGEIEAGFDTDDDGLPNFIDQDDDGDNVFTENENPDPDGDENLFDAQDTDEDGIPDYLDNDDDNDGILTIDEESDSPDKNPLNDITNSDVGPDFLNDAVIVSIPATGYRPHSIEQTLIFEVIVKDINLDFLSQDFLDFGTLSNTNTSETRYSLSPSRLATPIFP